MADRLLPKGWRVVACAVWLFLSFAGCSNPAAEKPKQSTPVDPATAGRIHVTVLYRGSVPAPSEINMQSAAACAKAHPQPVLDESLLVHDGHLRNAVVWIKSGLDKYVFAPPETAVRMDQVGCVYQPHVAATMVYQPVEFTNSDSESHNVHGKPQVLSSWNVILSRKGAAQEMVFDRPEIGIPIGCDIHPWMRSYLAVVPNPYFGISSEAGAVDLENVPPGGYVLEAWHEKLGRREIPIELAPSAKVAVEIEFPAGG